MINAEVHSDDRAVDADFDATLWFEQASDDEIMELEYSGWGGDYPADAVAQFFEDANSEVADVFKHVGHRFRVLCQWR